MIYLPSNALLHLSPPTALEKPQVISRTLAVHALSSGAECLASPRDDHWLPSSERPGDTRQNVLDDLAWEATLGWLKVRAGRYCVFRS